MRRPYYNYTETNPLQDLIPTIQVPVLKSYLPWPFGYSELPETLNHKPSTLSPTLRFTPTRAYGTSPC